jgi:hypothetical protein
MARTSMGFGGTNEKGGDVELLAKAVRLRTVGDRYGHPPVRHETIIIVLSAVPAPHSPWQHKGLPVRFPHSAG